MNDQENIKRQCDANLADPNLYCLVLQPNGAQARKECADKADVVLETYCNVGVNKVCHAVGYKSLENDSGPLMANQMLAYMRGHSEWKPCDASEAQKKAREGYLVIAAHEHVGHGHVAVVYPPGGLVFSGRWNCDVPTICNIGKDNKICGANYGFDTHETPPEYYWLDL